MIRLDNVNSWKNRFQERLVDITEFQDFKNVLEDERLQTFMSTPVSELSNSSNELGMSYKYVTGELSDQEREMTMKEFLLSFYGDFIATGEAKFYISEHNEIQGMIFYTATGDSNPFLRKRVQDLGFFSFDLNEGKYTLIKDTYLLIKDLLKKYRTVSWDADENNPACESYKRLCDKLGGEYFNVPDRPGIIHFSLAGDLLYKETLSLKESKQALLYKEKGIKELDDEIQQLHLQMGK